MREPRRHIPPILDYTASVSWRVLLVIALAGVVVYALSKLPFVVLALFLSFLVVSVLAPLRGFLERHGVGHLLAVWLVILLTALVTIGIIAAVVVPFIIQAGQLWESIREGIDEVIAWLKDGRLGLPEETVDRYVDQATAWFEENAQSIATGVVGTTMMGFQIITSIVLAVPIIFFFLKDSHSINRWLLSWVTPEQRERTEQVGSQAWKKLSTFIQGTALVATVDAVFIGLGLFILDVPLAGSLAVLTFVAAFIPIVGAFVAGIAAVLVAFVSQGLVASLIILGIVVGVQQLEGNVLAPIVVGRAVHLHPLAILLAIAIGGTLAGIMGAFMAVPLTAVLYAVAAELRRPTPVAANSHALIEEQETTEAGLPAGRG